MSCYKNELYDIIIDNEDSYDDETIDVLTTSCSPRYMIEASNRGIHFYDISSYDAMFISLTFALMWKNSPSLDQHERCSVDSDINIVLYINEKGQHKEVRFYEDTFCDCLKVDSFKDWILSVHKDWKDICEMKFEGKWYKGAYKEMSEI